VSAITTSLLAPFPASSLSNLAVLEFPFMKIRFFLTLLFAIPLFAQGAEVEITAEPHHHLVLENPYVRAYSVEVPPGQATLMHHHRHDYVFVTLGDTHVSNEVERWKPIELTIKDGETRFAPGDFAHIARNLAKTPFRNVTIEFMQDAETRKSPYHWDEERALHVFDKGTQDVIFVKDGVRVSEFELQPGGSVPSHHHGGPVLMVAVSDIDLRNAIQGQSPSATKLKSGEMKWSNASYTHSVTNIGKTTARFVSLEFPPTSPKN
jgi:quercetin dioxygenase-like cupin family protein